MTMNELKNTLQNEEQLSDEAMNAVSGGKIRYSELRNIPLTEEEKKELEELERRVSNS